METQEDKIQRVLRDPVTLVDYDPRWPDMFASEKQHLTHCLPVGLVVRVEHFGSTAVPGLLAKPIIDLLVEVSDLAAAREIAAPILEGQGYDYFWRPTHGDDGPPWYAWFIKRDQSSGDRSHHIHMVDASFVEHWARLQFRDYLIDHPDVAHEYATLKHESLESFPRDRVAYTQAKSAFIEGVMARIRESEG